MTPHYSPVIVAGSLVFISGQLPIDPSDRMRLVGADISTQARQALTNMEQTLSTLQLSRSNILKTTAFVTDMRDWDAVNAVYAEFFGDHRPARSIVEVRALHFGFGIEIEGIAVRKPQ